MQLAHYLKPQLIHVPLKATTKDEVLAELVAELCRREGIQNGERLLGAIKERELHSSTFLPMGVAVPHARVPDVKEIALVIGVTPHKIQDDPRLSPLTAQLFFLFFSPTEEKEFGKHLKLLARIAAIFSDLSLVEEVAHLESAEEIFQRIQKRERQLDRE